MVGSLLNVEFWHKNIQDQRAVQRVTYGIPLELNELGTPPLMRLPNHSSCLSHPQVIDEAVQLLLFNSFIEGPLSVAESSQTIFSPLGAVPKKDSADWRVILDTSQTINKYLQDLYMFLPTMDDVIEMVRLIGPGCFLAKFDLAAGFHQFPVRKSDVWMLGFSWNGANYCYTRLPMGLTCSPSLFQVQTDAICCDKITFTSQLTLTYFMRTLSRHNEQEPEAHF